MLAFMNQLWGMDSRFFFLGSLLSSPQNYLFYQKYGPSISSQNAFINLNMLLEEVRRPGLAADVVGAYTQSTSKRCVTAI